MSQANRKLWLPYGFLIMTVCIVLLATQQFYSSLCMLSPLPERDSHRDSLSHLRNDNSVSPRFAPWQNGNETLSHVVIPFHESQIGKLAQSLESWKDFLPCDKVDNNDKVARPTLVFHVTFAKSSAKTFDNVKASCLQVVEKFTPQVSACFRETNVVGLELDPKQQDTHDTRARLMFESLLRGEVTVNADYVLYIEPDVLSIRHNWLQRIVQEVTYTSKFWVMASVYRGKFFPIEDKEFLEYIPNMYHINGNAIYNLHAEAFPKFYFERIRPYVVAKHLDSLNAYETDAYEFHFDMNSVDLNRHVLHLFRYTDLIQKQWHTPWILTDLASQNPNTVLVHKYERIVNTVGVAKTIMASHDVVLFQVLNVGYVEMTKSWICNVRRFEGILTKTLFVTTDREAYDSLKKFDASLHVVLEPYASPKDLRYGQYAYYDFMLFRTNLILDLLKKGIKLWLVESDATWFKDPSVIVLGTEGDMVTMSDIEPPHLMVQGGFWLLRPTVPTIAIWTELLQQFQAVMMMFKQGDEMEDKGSEQHMMNKLVAAKIGDVNVSWLDHKQFVPGFYYTSGAVQAYVRDPAVILNNWIRGNAAKVMRAKEWGHWFLDEKEQCTHQTL